MIEKLIHLRHKNYYYPFQFGFHPKFSTNSAVMSVVGNIETNRKTDSL